MLKYPRTYHFSFSPGVTSDDKIVSDDELLKGKRVIITEKMDGENTTVYNNYWHARSLTSAHKSYHSLLIQRISEFQYLIPNGIRICGEDLCVKHSIYYDNIPDCFMGFSVWEDNLCYSWDDTIAFLDKINASHVPILYDGIFDLDKVKALAIDTVARGGEGIVVRNADSFNYEDFSKNVFKYVRPNHVTTDKHWAQSEITYNKIIR